MKTHPMKLEDHPSLAALADEIRTRVNIGYVRRKSGWTSELKGKLLEIGYADSPYALSCLAHELLHGHLKLNGFRQIKISFTSHGNQAMFSRFVSALDNELQHHRMFPDYLKLGLAPEHFYDHSESDIAGYFESDVFNASPTDILGMIPDFFTVLAPGGELTDASRSALLDRFKSWAGTPFLGALNEIEAALHDWSKAPSLDTESTVRRICRTMHDPCCMWFGYSESDRPPAKGFFVGPSFTVGN